MTATRLREMAGSQAPSKSSQDPILRARLEALQLLAARLSSAVLVVNRDLTIVYEHPAVSAGHAGSHRPAGSTTCHERVLRRTDRCEDCPASDVFESGRAWAPPRAGGGDEPRCGMRQALPLTSEAGQVGAVLVLFDKEPSARLAREEGEVGASSSAASPVLIGESAPMRDLIAMMRLVAGSSASILLQGESGTGKELAARTIHRLSPRRAQPFIVVDCSALPETLLESELFGHVKGAFTGAHANKKGLFEEADGGTIFLDEIADTTPQFQAKLLRVLQEGEVKAVGSSRPIKVDVRVISASNKDVAQLVKENAFREDLYYRLAVLPLFLPPLRERREDIPPLVRHFITNVCRRYRRAIPTIGSEVMSALCCAPWPGNVRQLQHLIERVIVTTRNPELTREDFFGRDVEVRAPEDLRSVASTAKEKAERARILQALEQAGGNRSRAAQALKISRASLYNKLRTYRIV